MDRGFAVSNREAVNVKISSEVSAERRSNMASRNSNESFKLCLPHFYAKFRHWLAINKCNTDQLTKLCWL